MQTNRLQPRHFCERAPRSFNQEASSRGSLNRKALKLSYVPNSKAQRTQNPKAQPELRFFEMLQTKRLQTTRLQLQPKGFNQEASTKKLQPRGSDQEAQTKRLRPRGFNQEAPTININSKRLQPRGFHISSETDSSILYPRWAEKKRYNNKTSKQNYFWF